MPLRHIFFVARRLGFGLRYDRLASVSVLAAMLGLAFGVAVLIVVLSVLNGFDHSLRTQLLRLIPHLTLHTKSKPDPDGELSRLIDQHSEIAGYAPRISGLVLASKPGVVVGARLNSLNFENAKQQHYFSSRINLGGSLPKQNFGIVIGRTLAQTLGVSVGDNLTLTAPAPRITPLGLFPRSKTFHVSAVVTTHTELDVATLYANSKDVEKLFIGQPKDQGWQLKLKDLFNAESVARSFLRSQSPELKGVTYWSQTHGSLYSAIRSQKVVMWLLLSLMVGVAIYNVIFSIGMLITRKRPNIAILLSLGVRPKDVAMIFIMLAAMVAIFGVAGGMLAGVGLSLVLDDLYLWFEAVTGARMMTQYFVDYLPIKLLAADFAWIALFSFSLILTTSLLLVRRISSVRPAEILRNE